MQKIENERKILVSVMMPITMVNELDEYKGEVSRSVLIRRAVSQFISTTIHKKKRA